MHKSVLQHGLFDTARAKLSARIESDDATRLEWWLAEPRAELACAVSGLGQRIMRLGNRIDDSAFDGDEHKAWEAGAEIGRLWPRPAPPRESIEALLTRLGIDTSDETMAKLGYTADAPSSAASTTRAHVA